jgi:hypothetical protein
VPEFKPETKLETNEPAVKLEDTKPVPVAKANVPAGTQVREEAEGGRVLITAPAGEPEQTADPLRPRSASDYSGYWVTVVPRMADAHKDIPAQRVKELSKAAMAESGNDAVRAYDLLRQKIAAARPG